MNNDAQNDFKENLMSRMFDVTDKTTVITGAAHGLGKMWAINFAQAGASVIAVDINETELQTLVDEACYEKCGLTTVCLDVTKPNDVEKFGSELEAKGEHIDVLINSAGITHLCQAEDFTLKDFEKVISVNLSGTFLMSQMAGKKMLRQGHGSIINIASIGGSIAYPNTIAYLSSKGGVVQLTRGLAIEWADKGVRINALAPSRIDTGFLRNEVEDTIRRPLDFLQERSVVKGLLDIDDLLGPALFLASDASKAVNGHILAVDNAYLAA